MLYWNIIVGHAPSISYISIWERNKNDQEKMKGARSTGRFQCSWNGKQESFSACFYCYIDPVQERDIIQMSFRELLAQLDLFPVDINHTQSCTVQRRFHEMFHVVNCFRHYFVYSVIHIAPRAKIETNEIAGA